MEIKKGMKVNYHSIIDEPPTVMDCTVEHDPWLPRGWSKKAGMVTIVDKLRGWVSVDALSEVKNV